MPELTKKATTIAPEYRYFTTDLLTGKILAEIPLRGVSYACALKAAGRFQGKIPVTLETKSMDLYNATMPGNTAIYVMRNGVCVWGGIIWARNYEFDSKDLSISASEFTSYFYHRKIWKTWHHEYGATVRWRDDPNDRVYRLYRTNLAAYPYPTAIGNGAINGYGTIGLIAHDTTYSRRPGVPSMRFDRNATSPGIQFIGAWTHVGQGTQNSDRLSVTPGETITFSAHFSANVSHKAAARIYWYNASNVLIGNVTGTTSLVRPANDWDRVGVTAPVPATAVRAAFSMEVYTNNVNAVGTEKAWITDALIERRSYIDVYFDGNFPESADYRYDIVGTGAAAQSRQFYGDNALLGWEVLLDNDSNVDVKPGSTVKLQFAEPSNFQYDGQYRVLDTPAPTREVFRIFGGSDVVDIVSREVTDDWQIYWTKEPHKFVDGDVVDLELTSIDGDPEFQIVRTGIVDVPEPGSNYFRFDASFYSNYERQPVEGMAGKTLPKGTYSDVTVTVRQDTYDYIRTLIQSTFDDFIGTDFPNVYIEPGVSWALPIASKQAIDGYAIIETEEPHKIAPGQAIQIQDLGEPFDGEYEVTDTPAPNVLVYERSGTVPLTAVNDLSGFISMVQMSGGVVTAITTYPHGFSRGQNVTVTLPDPYGDFSGTFKITDIPSVDSFRYKTNLTRSYSSTAMPYAVAAVAGDPDNVVVRAEVQNNLVTLELKYPNRFSSGDTVNIAGVNRDLLIAEKALDAPNNRATIKTAEDHGLAVGNTVEITGLEDYSNIVTKSTTTTSVTMTTERPHNFRVGNLLTITGSDMHKIVGKALTSNVATLTTEAPHNVTVGTAINVVDLSDSSAILSRSMTNNVATINLTGAHNFLVNQSVAVSGLTDTYSIISKEAVNGKVTLTTALPHNVLVGSKIGVVGVGVPFDSSGVTVDEVTATRITYKVDERYWEEQKEAAARNGQNLNVPFNVPLALSSGTVTSPDSFYNGERVITAVGATSISYALRGEDQPTVAASGSGYQVTGPSIFNGTYTVTAVGANTLTYARVGNNVAQTGVSLAANAEAVQPAVVLNTIHAGGRTITAVTATTFTFAQTLTSASTLSVALEARKPSIFNGTRTVTGVPTTDRFTFTLSGAPSNVIEQASSNPAFVRAGLYNGTYIISDRDNTRNTITFNKTLPNYGSKIVVGRGLAEVNPAVIISSFGPFPANANIDMDFATGGYTGINIEPAAYRGFELKSVGEALDSYSDNINGFEYRIDSEYDKVNDRFVKKFVLVPINFPNPPPAGTVAPLSRYGADKLIFEYPGGNISAVTIDESAEESATRFFAVGETDLGPEAGPNIGVASSDELLTGKDGRIWPLLDASETISGVNNKDELHAYAKRYLSESSPPYTTLKVSLNGSIAPFVGEYKPGDWCALILDDPFMRMRLDSELEPRNDVFVRKIASYTVAVPDGVTYPETVTLNLVAEWEVDKRGQ